MVSPDRHGGKQQKAQSFSRSASFPYAKRPPRLVKKMRRAFRLGRVSYAPDDALFWCNIIPELLGHSVPSSQQLTRWTYVLQASGIPFIVSYDTPKYLYVPCFLETLVCHEIRSFEKEQYQHHHEPAERTKSARGASLSALAWLSFLLVLHVIRMTFFLPPVHTRLFTRPDTWAAKFGVDSSSIMIDHEWWRAVTALCLHANTAHLVSNLVFGFFFLTLIFRRTGAGFGMLLVLLAGLGGNLAKSILTPSMAVSIGFSTAVFGAVGLACALAACDAWVKRQVAEQKGAYRQSLLRTLAMPLACGLAFFAMLGVGETERVDVVAHLWGLVCGVFLGVCFFPVLQWISRLDRQGAEFVQQIAATCTILIVALAWYDAVLAGKG